MERKKGKQAVCINSLDWIIKGYLAVGDLTSGTNLKKLKSMGIRGIISVVPQLPNTIAEYKYYDMAVLHIPIRDHPNQRISTWFDPVREFIHYFIKRNHGVLIHCHAGRSRSVTLLASYLMKTFNISSQIALNMIRVSRPCITINSGFRKQLDRYQRFLQFSTRSRKKSRSRLQSRSKKKY